MDPRMGLFELINEPGRDDEDRGCFLIELGYWHMEEIHSSFKMNPAFVGISGEQVRIKI